ncbi:hypothetical protein FRC01_007125 [Tulasnella sp. 417]|nr:hypothetical protein FRC01_007125 [Tulasnella sp. 417]
MDPLAPSPPLNSDILLAILSHLAVRDVLAMRQVSKALRDLTQDRSVWIPHYAQMVRARQLPTPMVDHNLSQPYMEAAVRRNKLVESAWRQANPKMESLQFVTLPGSEHNWIGDIQRGFMVPGGRYFMIFSYDRGYLLSLEELSEPPVPFLSLRDVNLDGMDVTTCRWTTARPADGSLTFIASMRPADRAIQSWTFALRSASFQVSPPSQTYHGQFTISETPYNSQAKDELFIYNTGDTGYVIVFDWKALLQGGSFRYCALRIHNPDDVLQTRGIRDFCMLPNGCILAIEYGSDSLHLFAAPEFQTVSHLNQPLPTESATPLWQYHALMMDDHYCIPFEIWSLPLCHPRSDSDESGALLCGVPEWIEVSPGENKGYGNHKIWQFRRPPHWMPQLLRVRGAMREFRVAIL